MDQHTNDNTLFCKRVLNEYRGFRLSTVKLIIEYSFPGHLIKVERNNRELRFDIYLREFGDKVLNLIELERFKKYYGKGLNIIIYSEKSL